MLQKMMFPTNVAGRNIPAMPYHRLLPGGLEKEAYYTVSICVYKNDFYNRQDSLVKYILLSRMF
jgi:hypothetical protein